MARNILARLFGQSETQEGTLQRLVEHNISLQSKLDEYIDIVGTTNEAAEDALAEVSLAKKTIEQLRAENVRLNHTIDLFVGERDGR